MRFEFMKFNGCSLSRALSRRCGRLHTPHLTFDWRRKSMKKVLASLIFVGLCTAVFLSTPVSSEKKGIGTEQAKFRKNANKIENSYIVVLDEAVIGETGKFSIAPYVADELAGT